MANSSQPPLETPALLPRDALLVVVNAHPDEEVACAVRYGVGVEIQSFSMPPLLEDPHGPALDAMTRRIQGRVPRIGCHGPFMDVIHCSPDSEVRALARRRYFESFDIAQALGASYVIFHSQYNVMVKIPEYSEIYHTYSMKFWPDVLEEAERRGLNIYVENMFDDRPEPLRRLAQTIDSPRFGLCLDIAHVALHSALSSVEWVAALGPWLRHVHMNDNQGEFDEHLGLGQGQLELDKAIAALKAASPSLTYTLETNGHAEASLAYLGIEPL